MSDRSMVPKQRLLHVEDSEALRRLIARYFRDRGFEVVSSIELEEAKALLDMRDFDVLITDLQLTDLDRGEGLDVISHARYHRQDLRIIVLTGVPSFDLERACRQLGADAFLTKPQSLASLFAVATSARESTPTGEATSTGEPTSARKAMSTREAIEATWKDATLPTPRKDRRAASRDDIRFQATLREETRSEAC